MKKPTIEQLRNYISRTMFGTSFYKLTYPDQVIVQKEVTRIRKFKAVKKKRTIISKSYCLKCKRLVTKTNKRFGLCSACMKRRK